MIDGSRYGRDCISCFDERQNLIITPRDPLARGGPQMWENPFDKMTPEEKEEFAQAVAKFPKHENPYQRGGVYQPRRNI